MCRRTIAVAGLATMGLLAAAGPATAEEGDRSAAPCVAARVQVAGGQSITLLDTPIVRALLQGLVRPAEETGPTDAFGATEATGQPFLTAETSFAAAAEFPGLLDDFLLDDFLLDDDAPGTAAGTAAGTDTGTDTGTAADTAAGTDAEQVLEPLVITALGCGQAEDTSEAGAEPTGAEPTGAEPASLLDAAGAAAVLEALVNRPAMCTADGTAAATAGASADGTAGDVSASRMSLLDAIGVRRTLDMLIGRPSVVCAADGTMSLYDTTSPYGTTSLNGTASFNGTGSAGVPLSADMPMSSYQPMSAIAPQERRSVLDALGIRGLLDGLLG
ncbi:hypothetical protein DMB42_29485 [Nonomuraea sp. WAC 01424]|uniref:hypothetical protein n=1 Tax=Nonomuraea sp. WAC 01424 TaxID=2203200 RepID=UPI000F787375|nr:hypothetical protein [Nonomuraea sp. WAC 01424]RSN04924.1 hypothetical protein DMB42_29485 [Nonomuraea sp. WAC 01424]